MRGFGGYVGNKQVVPLIIDGLKKLEYRGSLPFHLTKKMFPITLLRTLFCCAVYVSALCMFADAQSEKKISVGILMDNTGSLRPLAAQQREFASLILDKVPQGSVFSLYGFATDTAGSQSAKFASGLECSSDRKAMLEQLNAVPTVAGQTTLMDAIESATERLQKPVAVGCQQSEELLLIVLSDGEDRASTVNVKQFFPNIKATGVKVYVVAVLKDLSRERGFISESPHKKAKQFLTRLASESGGRIVFFEKNASPGDLIEQLFSKDYVFPK